MNNLLSESILLFLVSILATLWFARQAYISKEIDVSWKFYQYGRVLLFLFITLATGYNVITILNRG